MAPEAPPTAEQPRQAGLPYRAAARIVDAFVISLGFIAVGTVVAGRLAADAPSNPFVADLIVYGVAAVYEIVPTALHGQTLGKRILQLRVVRLPDLGRPGMSRSFIRWLVPAAAFYVLGYVPAPLGYVTILLVPVIFLVALIDPRRQGLHDRAAGTIVVTEREM